MVDLPYFQLNMIEEYNNNMNNVDIADQLRAVYRCNKWMRKRKLYWLIFFWSLELLITNSYVLQRKYHVLHNKKSMSHFQCHRQIAMAWICPSKDWKGEGSTAAPSHNSMLTTSSTTSSILVTKKNYEQLKTNKIFNGCIINKQQQKRDTIFRRFISTRN